MRHRYLLLAGLLPGLATPDTAQAQSLAPALPPTVRSREHSWYVLPMVAAAAPLRFSSTSSLLQPAANAIQPTYGIALGYAHNQRFALETGLCYVPAYGGYRLHYFDKPLEFGTAEPYVFAPLRLVVSLWEPTPRLAVRALLGAGYGWRQLRASEDYNFTQSQRFVTTFSGSDTLTLRHASARRRNFFAAEAGLRLEWKCREDVAIALEVRDDLTLGARNGQHDYTLTNAAQGTTLAVAQLVSRQHVLAVGLGVRYTFYQRTAYRYRQVK